VDEVAATLGGAAFVVVRWCGGAAADELAGDMTTEAGVRKRVDDFADAGGEGPKTVGELFLSHGSWGNRGGGGILKSGIVKSGILKFWGGGRAENFRLTIFRFHDFTSRGRRGFRGSFGWLW